MKKKFKTQESFYEEAAYKKMSNVTNFQPRLFEKVCHIKKKEAYNSLAD